MSDIQITNKARKPITTRQPKSVTAPQQATLPDWAEKLNTSGRLGPGGIVFAPFGYPHMRNATLAILDLRNNMEKEEVKNPNDPYIPDFKTLNHLCSACDYLGLEQETEILKRHILSPRCLLEEERDYFKDFLFCLEQKLDTMSRDKQPV